MPTQSTAQSTIGCSAERITTPRAKRIDDFLRRRHQGVTQRRPQRRRNVDLKRPDLERFGGLHNPFAASKAIAGTIKDSRMTKTAVRRAGDDVNGRFISEGLSLLGDSGCRRAVSQ